MPGPVLHDELSHRFVMDFSASAKTDLLLGTIDLDEKHDYNAAMLVSEKAVDRNFIERLSRAVWRIGSGSAYDSLLARVVGDQVPGDFGFGKEHVFRLANDRALIAPLICFEDTMAT